MIGFLLPFPYVTTLIFSYIRIEAPYIKYQQVNNTASNAYFPVSELVLTVLFISLRFVEYLTFLIYICINKDNVPQNNNSQNNNDTQVTTKVGENKIILWCINGVFLFLSLLAAAAILGIGLTKDLFTAGIVHNNNCGIPKQNSTKEIVSIILIKRGLQSASYAVSITIRCLFSCLAISVTEIWFENANPTPARAHDSENSENIQPTHAQGGENYQSACENVVKQHNIFNTKYTKKGKRVLKLPLFRSFTPWFVIQFFIYFLALFEDVVHALRPLTHGTELTLNKCERFDVAEVCLYVSFDVIRFAWPYVIGILMLKAHYKYFEILEEKYEHAVTSERVGSDLRKAIAGTMPLHKNLDYDFSPQFLLFNIPLNSSGYFFTVIIAFIALVANFLVPTLPQVR